MELTKAARDDMDEILGLYRVTAEGMEAAGLRLWHWGEYPNEEILRGDMEAGNLFIRRIGGELAGCVVVSEYQEEEYRSVEWSLGVRPGYIYRLAVSPDHRGKGLGPDILEDALKILRERGCDCARSDTGDDNGPTISLYERKMGFRRCGIIYWYKDERASVCFEKPLKRETPQLPLRMVPAFRGEKDTSWGGKRLQELYGKNEGAARTGESYEVSCVPGLESSDAAGNSLRRLIAENGRKLIGKYAGSQFPLTIKLLDSGEGIGAMVRPKIRNTARRGNAAAGGKAVWLIVDAPEDAWIICGLKPGTTARDLKEACLGHGDPEALMRKTPVKKGDVFCITAGCLFGAGPGILIYEISQTPEAVYCLRAGEKGSGRRGSEQSHALTAINTAADPRPIHVRSAFGGKRVVNEKEFTMDLVQNEDEIAIPKIHDFGMVTVFREGMSIAWDGGELKLPAGGTCIIPYMSPPGLVLRGLGEAVLTMPV